MKLLRGLSVLALALLAGPALAANQAPIQTPVAGPMSAATFTAIYLNPALLALGTCSWGPTPPVNGPGSAPTFGQCWMDTSTSPADVLRTYDSAIWVAQGTLNVSTHSWNSNVSSGLFLGSQQNILISPGDPTSGPGGNTFNGGIITQILTGNFQASAYQLAPTTGTAPTWGPISEFVSRRVDGTNFQRISFTSMAAWAGPSLNDAASDFRIQAEQGGASPLLPIRFTSQQNTAGLLYEYLTLAPNNDGNVRMFRRIDPPGLSANNLSLTLGQQQSLLANVLTSAGVQDSPKFILEGNSFDTALHTASIRQYVETTSNAGAARWHLQYSLDGAGFVDVFSATSAGVVTATTINGTNINATTFAGALTGHASLDLATSALGTGVQTALAVNIGSAGAFTTFNGAQGTPSSITLTNATGLPLSTGVTGTLQAAQEPAHTGDCTNTAGSLALTCLKTNGVSFGTAATVNTGTSGATIPLLSADNTYSGQAVFTSSKVLALTGNASGGGFQVSAFNMWGGTNPTLSGSGATVTTYPTQGVSIAINHSDGSSQLNGLTVGAGQLGGVTLGAPTGSDKGLGTINAAGAYYSNGTIGLTCSGTPTASFASTLGIVTHC